jgi:hypothetical protein
MQNLVYPSVDAAICARRAEFLLASCEHCGFAFNAAFDPNALLYDERYDNRVSSDVFKGYYADLARHLHQRYGDDGGLVVEIGCGKGEFTMALAAEWLNGRFLGVDPGYERPSSDAPVSANVEFVSDVFKPSTISERPSLVVCRHTLEHIPDPVSFLRQVRSALPKDVPIYLEVPDLRWIVENQAFWDFCYEHCNYFTSESLAFTVQLAGFRVVSAGVGFGNQYLWLEGISGDEYSDAQATSTVGQILRHYAHDEARRIAQTRALVEAEVHRGNSVCLWGMATKGVVFSFLIDADRSLLRHCIDMNSNKQGKYAPGSAHLIQPPEVLRSLSGEVLILVMNPNYLNEIRDKCHALGIAARFADARCESL